LFPFINEEALDVPQVFAIPLFRKNELYAFFEIPALTLDRYADRGLGVSAFAIPAAIMTCASQEMLTPNRILRRKRAKPKEHTCDQCKNERAADGNPKMPEVPTRAKKKKCGSGGGE
jgi:hypothetical protein